MHPKDVSIIIPAFNEELAIEEVVTNLKKCCDGAEIIVINDGSTDQTAQLAEKAGAKVINHDIQCGYGASLRTGVRISQRPYVMSCDADGQHQIEDVLNIIANCNENCDIVIGARDANSHVPFSRKPGKFILKHFANFLAQRSIPDLNSGLRIMRREIILKYLHLMPAGFSFSTTSTFAFLKSGRTITWVPITVKERKGQSTVRQWKHGPITIMLMLRITVLFEPFKIFLPVSIVLGLLGSLCLSFELWKTNFQEVGEVTVTLFLASLLVFMFGLLCDQVSAIRRELHEH